jgi:hypothetical protein
MTWKRIVLILAVLAAAAVSAGTLMARSQAPQQEPPAFVQWSVNGDLVGTREPAPARARDFHASWTTGGAVLVWTKNGTVNSGAIESPSGANDIRVKWGRLALRFKAAFWTKDGTDLQAIPIAAGSNDLYLRLNGGGVFDSARWTGRTGNTLQPIVPAPGANDVRLELKSALRHR